MLLQAERLETPDAMEAIELFYQKGWTDGLPIVPPTAERILAMLSTVDMQPDTVLGAIPERGRVFTAEVVAINAVMAGCLPEYFPVVVAGIAAISDPVFGLHGPTASTHGAGILMIVNGPIIQGIGLNCGQGLFGPGHRANATIGRALRLVLINAGGSPGFDRTTLGHPGKYTYCIAEDENTDWLPLHVQRGFDKTVSTVTVFAGEGPNQMNNHTALRGENILLTLADRMSALGTFNMGGQTEMVVVICPEHYRTLNEQGWDKAKVQEFLYEHAARPLVDLKEGGYLQQPVQAGDEKILVRAVPSPADILLIVAGGEAGRFSACIPGWFNMKACHSVTKAIRDVTCGT
ncbi:MAG: hypothetical protein JSW39_12360 [Desulfobacterales bacterium]|nr:MAG: hypothetical protein JSW39_12360 [Desulfobacterales bacterium]